MQKRLFIFLSFLILSYTVYSQDVICICGGTLIDGSSKEPFIGDLEIRGDSINVVGRIPDTSFCDKWIDARNKIVAPGFIDMHAHGDPLKQSSFQNFLAMGVTTIVLGMDGTGIDHDFKGVNSFQKYSAAVHESDLSINVIPFVGHNTLLAKHSGDLNAMLVELDTAFTTGAWGLSMGLEYTPGIHSTTEELLPLAQKVGDHQGMIMAHIRSEDDDAIESAINEMAELNKLCQAHVAHLKVVYGKGAERALQILAQLESANLSADLYPYLASYTGIAILFPKWAKTQESFDQALIERKEELAAYLEQRIAQRNGPEATLICSGPYTGKTLSEVAQEKQLSPVQLLMQWGPKYGSGAYFIMDSTLQITLGKDTAIAFSTDGSPTMHHPRGYGTYAKILSEWVVENNSLSLPLAIYKMTALPAKTLGLKKRGLLKAGFKADVIMFDLDKVIDRADYVSPKTLSEGFEMVWINGALVWDNGVLWNSRAGNLLLK